MEKQELLQSGLEALKLVLRLYVIAVVPATLLVVLNGLDLTTGSMNINWGMVQVVFYFNSLTFIIAGIDKWKHEYAKDVDPDANSGKSNGLVPF